MNLFLKFQRFQMRKVNIMKLLDLSLSLMLKQSNIKSFLNKTIHLINFFDIHKFALNIEHFRSRMPVHVHSAQTFQMNLTI